MSKKAPSKVKSNAGRPTKYDPKYMVLVRDYVDRCKKEKKIPQVEGLRLELGVARSTMYEWAETHKEFSDTLEDLKSVQQVMLVEGGISGKYNAQITKLMLSVNHGMVETSKQNIDLKSEGFVVNIIEERSKK